MLPREPRRASLEGFVSTAMTSAVSNRSRDRTVGDILLGRACSVEEAGLTRSVRLQPISRSTRRI